MVSSKMSKPDPETWREAKTEFWAMSPDAEAKEEMEKQEELLLNSTDLSRIVAEHEETSVRYNRSNGPHETGYDPGTGSVSFEMPSGICVTADVEAEYVEEHDYTVLSLEIDDDSYGRIMPGKKNYHEVRSELEDLNPEITDLGRSLQE